MEKKLITCQRCKGKGEVEKTAIERNSMEKEFKYKTKCVVCQGKGVVEVP